MSNSEALLSTRSKVVIAKRFFLVIVFIGILILSIRYLGTSGSIQHSSSVMRTHTSGGLYWLGEQPTSAGYWRKTIGLLTDGPHVTSELIFSGMENLIILGIGFMIGRRALRRQHEELDEEHGFVHSKDQNRG